MKTFNVVTHCGVHTRVNALNSFQATIIARTEGWVVIGVYLC